MKMNGDTQNIISFAEFELDSVHRQLRREGKPVPINSKTFDLLAFLVERNGETLSKDEILEAVWSGQFVEEANLSVQISALRKVFGETKTAPRFLLTIPGVGYKFVADMSNGGSEIVIEKHKISRVVVEEDVSDTDIFNAPGSLNGKSLAFPNVAAPPRYPTSQILAFAGIAVFLALVIGGGAFWLFKGTPEENRAGNIPVIPAEQQPKVKRLTNHGRVNTAVLSPDGKFFAYSFVERGSLGTELRLGQTDGGSETVLRPLGDVRYRPRMFSADGRWLYYTVSELRETNGGLYKMPVLGGVPQKLADNVSVWLNVSHDEKQIAFVRENKENETSLLVVADIDGSNEREIVVRPYDLYLIEDSQTWSADGQFIAFSAANGANRKNASNKHFEIFVVRLADGSLSQLTALEWNTINTIEWFKDGSGLTAVARDKDKVTDLQLWQIDYPGGKARLLSRDANTYAGELSVSADSNDLLVVQREMEANIWVAPAGSLKEAQQITFSSSGRQDGWQGMDFAPDGQIVYTAWVDQSLTIWIMDELGANARQLTSIGFRDEKPAVAADGRFIVFQSDRSGKTEIWRMDIDGSNLRQLTFSGENYTPDVTPDSEWVVFHHRAGDDKDTIWRVSSTGGEPVQMTDNKSFNARVSPDGRFVACIYEIDEKPKLVILLATGGEPIRVLDVPKTAYLSYRISWTPDGKFITYPDRASGIWRHPVDGGNPHRLDGLPNEYAFTHSWSRNGQNLAFGRSREIREAVLISDFR